ncbi:insulinase family protein, partial [Flavobacteriaceae bacterium]|nr:insulinase family protein [Flavobacteriaceae bacterium]
DNLNANKIADFEKGQYHGGIFTKEKDLEQVHNLIGFESLSYLDDDYYKCQILASILGGGMSSRLFQEVREERGLAYSIYAFNLSNADSGLFGIYCGTDPKKSNDMLKVVRDEVCKITQNITEKELQRSISQIKAGLLMGQESSHSRCQRLGADVLARNRIVSHAEIIEKISDISVIDICNLANRIFFNKNSKSTFAALGKIKGNDVFSEFL